MQVLTLGAARRTLWNVASSAVYDEGNTAEVETVNLRINLAIERFFTSVYNWRGTLQRAAISAYDGQITLPRALQTVLGVRGTCGKLQVRPIWFEFLAGSCSLQCTSGLNDLGEGFTTFRDIPFPAQIVIRSDEDEDFEGEMTLVIQTEEGVSETEVDLSNAETLLASPLMTSIFKINKPVTQNRVNIYYLDEDYAEVLICTLKPTETDANYRRYRVNTRTDTVDAICKRAYLPALDDLESLVPNNFGALKLMLMSLQFEDKNDLERSMQYEQKAVALADADRQQFDGDNQVPIYQVTPGFGAASIPQFI